MSFAPALHRRCAGTSARIPRRHRPSRIIHPCLSPIISDHHGRRRRRGVARRAARHRRRRVPDPLSQRRARARPARRRRHQPDDRDRDLEHRRCRFAEPATSSTCGSGCCCRSPRSPAGCSGRERVEPLSTRTLYGDLCRRHRRHRADDADAPRPSQRDPRSVGRAGPLGGRYYEEESGREIVYRLRRLPAALGISFTGGMLSGLLGHRRRHPAGAGAQRAGAACRCGPRRRRRRR